MYGQGSGVPTKVVPAVLGVSTAAVLPQTGMNSAMDIALAAVAALAIWAIVYVAMAKFAKR
jgi:LPXTG-motif cell wall-anchored protein